MTEAEMEDLENHLASHLKPVKPGADHWAKAMKLIRETVKLQVEKALVAEEKVNQSVIETAYRKGYEAGQGLKG